MGIKQYTEVLICICIYKKKLQETLHKRLRSDQTYGDRILQRVPFLAPSAEMAAPPAAVKESDALACYGIFTGLFACVYVRRFLRRRGQVFFASAHVTYSVRESPC